MNGRWEINLPESSAQEWAQLALPHPARPDGGWEVVRLLRLEEMVQPGTVVLYVGAYKGEMAALLAFTN